MSAQSTAAPDGGLLARAREVLQAGVANVAATASKKVEGLTDKLEDTAAEGGVGLTAGMHALDATDEGKNPVWAAAKGAWSGASGKTKFLVILTLVLVLLLGPVLLVLLLLALLVFGIVKGVRAATA